MMAFYSRRDKDDDSDAWHNKCNALARLERHEGAIECYDKAIRLTPEDYGAWYSKGNSLDELERYEEAIGWRDQRIRNSSRRFWLEYGVDSRHSRQQQGRVTRSCTRGAGQHARDRSRYRCVQRRAGDLCR